MHTILAELRVESVERFLSVFSTEGQEKRAGHGSLGAQVLAVPEEPDRVPLLIDWPNRAAFEAFLADPSVAPTMAKGGAKGRPAFTAVTRAAHLPA